MRRSQEEAAKSGWSFESNGRRTTSKPLEKLCLQGSFTEDGKDWTEELNRHCTEICDGPGGDLRGAHEGGWLLERWYRSHEDCLHMSRTCGRTGDARSQWYVERRSLWGWRTSLSPRADDGRPGREYRLVHSQVSRILRCAKLAGVLWSTAPVEHRRSSHTRRSTQKHFREDHGGTRAPNHREALILQSNTELDCTQ